MKKRILLCSWILSLLSGDFLYSQHAAPVAKEKPIIKLSFLPMFHVDNSFVIGAELPLAGGRFSLQPEVGYGTIHSNVWHDFGNTGDYPYRSTFRTKLQFRSYIKEGGVFRTYFGGEYAYRQSDYLQEYQSGEQPATERELELRRSNHAMHGILGWQGYSSHRISVDFHIGFGLRLLENSAVSEGLSASELTDIRIGDHGWFGRSRRLGNFGPYPSFIGAVQLGFILGKIK